MKNSYELNGSMLKIVDIQMKWLNVQCYSDDGSKANINSTEHMQWKTAIGYL
jgi:hypothetical protein